MEIVFVIIGVLFGGILTFVIGRRPSNNDIRERTEPITGNIDKLSDSQQSASNGVRDIEATVGRASKQSININDGIKKAQDILDRIRKRDAEKNRPKEP